MTLDPAGYLYYLLAVLLPGFGLAEVLGFVRNDRTFTEALAYSIGLGLAFDTVIIFITSSGIPLMGTSLSAVSINDFYIIVALGVVFVLTSLAIRRNLVLPRFSRLDGLVLLFMLTQAGLLFLFFSKYPIFPEYNSADYAAHAALVKGLLGGSAPVPGPLLYYGVHYQLALGVILTRGVIIVVNQRIVAILAVLATPIIFLAASRLLSSNQAGGIAAILYSLTASIWFGSLFNAGLYPNFFGIVASLFLLSVIADVAIERMRLGMLIALALATGTFYLGHYSDITTIPAILVIPLILLLTGKLGKKDLVQPLFVLLPAILGAALFPALVSELRGFLANAGGFVIGGTYLSGVLSPVPVIAYMATETYYDAGFVILVVLSLAYVRNVFREKQALPFVPFIWFLSVVLVSPFNAGAWRFSYVGLVPLMLMASGGLVLLLPKPQKSQRHNLYRSPHGVLVGIILILLLAGSWGVTIVSDSTTNTQLSAQAQQNVYDAILWLGNNTHGSYLSVSDFRFLYTQQLIGMTTTYDFLSTPPQAIAYAHSVGASYIIVTQLVTASVPPVPSLFPWNNFPTASTGNLTLLYSNDDVRIYAIK